MAAQLVSRPVFLGIKPPSGAYDQIFNIDRPLRVCLYGAPSLTRGWVYRLQLPLSSPAQSFLRPSPAGLMTTFYCLRFETHPTWRTRSLYLYPPGTGWPVIPPGTGLLLCLTNSYSFITCTRSEFKSSELYRQLS
jgi:hypothetical protein